MARLLIRRDGQKGKDPASLSCLDGDSHRASVHTWRRRARLRHWLDPLVETQQIAVPAGLGFRKNLCPIRTAYSNTPQVNILTSDYLHVIIGHGHDPAVCLSASISVTNCALDASPTRKKRANRAPELQQIHQLTNA